MSLMDRLLMRGRLRNARQRLAEEASVTNYVTLAREHARTNDLDAALKVCEEGLALFPGNNELSRLARRSQQLEVGGRVRELARELREAPRAALYDEMCELLLSSGRPERADEYAVEWYETTDDPEALLMRARAYSESFRLGRGRDDGRQAWAFVNEAVQALPDDERALSLLLDLTCRVGAWNDALNAATRLLELAPGDPQLESRYRALQARADDRVTFESALREVEKTGLFADELADAPMDGRGPSNSSVRTLLKEISAEADVQAALYVRGSTALVQGPRGATAERTARAVREVMQQSRNTARRLGLGQAREVRVEGAFGSLLVVPGGQGAGAVWRRGPTSPEDRHDLERVIVNKANRPERRRA